MRSSSSLQCFHCSNDFDLTDRLPRILIQCGHTVCNACLKKLLEGPNQCPSDKIKFTGQKKVDAFPINFAIRSIIEEGSQIEMCEAHGEKIIFVCMTDKARVCAYCRFYGDHKDHTVKPIADMSGDVNANKKKLETMLGSLDKYHNTVKNLLDNNEKELVKISEDQFDQLQALLTSRKKELISNIGLFFDAEREKLNYTFGKFSFLKTALTSKITEYKRFLETLKPIHVLEEDVSDLLSKLDYTATDKYVEEIKQKTDQVTSGVNQVLASQIELVSGFQGPTTTFQNLIAKVSQPEDLEKTLEKLNLDLKFLPISSSLVLAVSDKSLEIIVSDRDSAPILMDIEKWNRTPIDELKIKFESSAISQKDLMIVQHIWSKLDRLTSVKVLCNNLKDMSDATMSQFFITPLRHPGMITDLEFGFAKTKIGDITLKNLSNIFTLRMANLRALKVSLAETKISSSAFDVFAQKLAPLLQYLNKFSFSLSRTYLTERVISKLFVEMPEVRNFELNLDCTNILDPSIRVFAENTMRSMANLDIFVLWLYNTQVTDTGLAQIAKALQPFKKLRLDLRSTRIGDKSVLPFAKYTLANMKDIQALDIKLHEGQVTDQTMELIERIKNSI